MKNDECCGQESCDTEKSECPAGMDREDCCPVEKKKDVWMEAFFCTMQGVKNDIQKEKIKKAWGANMEKAADAVLEAAGVCWTTTLAQAEAKQKLMENLSKIFREGKK